MVAPRVRAAWNRMGRCSGRPAADCLRRGLAVHPTDGWPEPGLRREPDRRQDQRTAAAVDPGLVQPADGPPVDPGRGADRTRHDGYVLVGHEQPHAGGAAVERKPRPQHPVPGHGRSRRQDRDQPASFGAADDHFCHAGAHPDATASNSASNARQPARRKAGCNSQRSLQPRGAVVGRLVIDLLRRREGRAGRHNQGRRRHRHRPRRCLLTLDLAGGRPARLPSRRQDRGSHLRIG